jgi:hypothetical protein
MTDKNKAILELVPFLETIEENKIHFYCNTCLEKKGYWVPPSFNFHDIGICEGDCARLGEVSVPIINVKVQELNLSDVSSIRRLIWNPRLHIIRNERLKSHMQLKQA